MKLTDLDPRFLKSEGPYTHRYVDALEEAQGVKFLCPKCYVANNGPIGTHSVMVWFDKSGVLDSALPGPGRWNVSGSGFADLTLYPSIHLSGEGCGWHGYVVSGNVNGA